MLVLFSSLGRVWPAEERTAGKSVAQQAVDPIRLKLEPTLERCDLEQTCKAHHVASQLTDEIDGGPRSPTGGENIIDYKDLLALLQRVAVHLQAIRSVLQCILRPDGWPGKLADLSDRDEAAAECERERRSDDEATRFDGRYTIDPVPRVDPCERFDDFAESPRVEEEGGNVTEEDAGRREVGHIMDKLLQMVEMHFGGVCFDRA